MERDLTELIPERLRGILVSTPDTLSGAIRFAGRRIPVDHFFGCYNFGTSVEEYMEEYDFDRKEDLLAVLEWQDEIVRAALGLDRAS